MHGAMSGEGAVLIERGEHGTHEQMRKRRNSVPSIGESSAVSDTGSEEDEEESFQRRQRTDGENPSGASSSAGSIEEANNGDDDAPPSSGDGGGGDQKRNIIKVFACGAAAGTVQAFVICPMEHIKCCLQVHAGSSGVANNAAYKGPIDVAASILKNHGITGLYRGMCVTLWRDTPAFGMYFATYDAAKDRVELMLEEGDGRHPIPSHAHAWAASALAGGMSGAFTWAIIYPFDVIKTRIQTSPLDTEKRRGMVDVARDIAREHGWRHMFRGLGVTLARAFPVNAIIFPVYEAVLMQLGDG